MDPALKPATEDDVRDIVAAALADETPVEVAGNGSKRALGRYAPLNRRVDVSALSGITMYEPDELVLTARAGTPLIEIEEAAAANLQALAFEPPDFAKLFGDAPGAQTIGGVLACNLSGPRRFRAGAARDHFLGVRAVSGRGEIFKSGGRVVKNVTGYDMCKLLAGSFGTLAVMTEVTIKVLPAPEKTRTILVYGLNDGDGIRALAAALKSPHDVSAAAHLPRPIAGRSEVGYVRDPGEAVTAVRVEGPEPSVIARCEALRALLAPFGEVEELHRHNSTALWREVGNATPLAEPGDRLVWRLSVPPASGADVVSKIVNQIDVEAYYDWGGGLIWLAVDPGETSSDRIVGDAVAAEGGHALLVRAPEETRARAPVFSAQPGPVAALTARIKEGFDPKNILNPGRMYADV